MPQGARKKKHMRKAGQRDAAHLSQVPCPALCPPKLAYGTRQHIPPTTQSTICILTSTYMGTLLCCRRLVIRGQIPLLLGGVGIMCSATTEKNVVKMWYYVVLCGNMW